MPFCQSQILNYILHSMNVTMKICCGFLCMERKEKIAHTFDHDHVDVYGADRRLRQTLPLLQNVWDLTGGDAIIWLSSERHQLPDSHSCARDGTFSW